MSAVSEPRRWLFVVARDRADVTGFMSQEAFVDPDAAVVEDRRRAGRRRISSPVVTERRRGERRRLQVAEHIARYGFAVVDVRRGQVIPPPAATSSGRR